LCSIETVQDIFDVRNAVTLKTGLRGQSRSLETSPFDTAHMTRTEVL